MPLEGYVPTLTQHPRSEAVHHYFPKAGNFPGMFWKVASGSHNDSENTESVLRVQVTPMSPANGEDSVGSRAPGSAPTSAGNHGELRTLSSTQPDHV